MTALTNGATTLTLPDDMVWSDEYVWQPVVQRAEYTLTGALLLESAARQAGRPITLEAGQDSAWMARSLLDQLRAWATTPGTVMSLLLRGTARDVVFDHERGGLQAQALVEYSDPDASDHYVVTLRFLEV